MGGYSHGEKAGHFGCRQHPPPPPLGHFLFSECQLEAQELLFPMSRTPAVGRGVLVYVYTCATFQLFAFLGCQCFPFNQAEKMALSPHFSISFGKINLSSSKQGTSLKAPAFHQSSNSCGLALPCLAWVSVFVRTHNGSTSCARLQV